MRRAVTALVLAGGLAAVFVTAAQTPHRRSPFSAIVGPSGYVLRQSGSGPGSVPATSHQVTLTVGPASCVLSWTNLGGIALCTNPTAHSLPPNVTATVHRLLQKRTGRRPLNCENPMAQPGVSTGSFIVACVVARTTQASFSLKGVNQASFSVKGVKARMGSPNSIAVNTFVTTFGSG
jgi:hypothetical protein